MIDLHSEEFVVPGHPLRVQSATRCEPPGGLRWWGRILLVEPVFGCRRRREHNLVAGAHATKDSLKHLRPVHEGIVELRVTQIVQDHPKSNRKPQDTCPAMSTRVAILIGSASLLVPIDDSRVAAAPTRGVQIPSNLNRMSVSIFIWSLVDW